MTTTGGDHNPFDAWDDWDEWEGEGGPATEAAEPRKGGRDDPWGSHGQNLIANGHDEQPPAYELGDPGPEPLYEPLETARARGRRRDSAHILEGDVAPLPVVLWPDSTPPARQWVVDGWIPAGHVSGLYAAGGTGKSILTLQLLISIAAGQPFLNMRTMSGPVMGIFCEDDPDELHRRTTMVCDAMGIHLHDIADSLYLYSRIGHDNTLMAFPSGIGDPGELTALWHAFSDQMRTVQPVMITVDTISDTFAGNESDRLQARRFVQACLGRWCIDHNTTVLALAHPSRSGITQGDMQSGSTAWEGAMRSRLTFRRPEPRKDIEDDQPNRNERILTLAKTNYSPLAGEQLRLRFDAGAYTALSLSYSEQNMERHRLAKLVEQQMRELADRGHDFSLSPRSPSHVPKVLAEHSKVLQTERALTVKMVNRIVADMLAGGVLMLQGRGGSHGRVQQQLFFVEASTTANLFPEGDMGQNQ